MGKKQNEKLVHAPTYFNVILNLNMGNLYLQHF